MKIKIVSLGLVLIALLAACGGSNVTQADSWQEYRAFDNSFAVDVPAPFSVTPHQVITPMGPVSAPLFSQQGGGNSYFLSYVDLPSNYLTTTAQERILESGIASVLQSQGAMLDSKSDFQMQGVPGKAFTGTIRSSTANGQEKLLHARVYVVNGRLYQVYVLGVASDVDSARAVRYLDSFHILNGLVRR